MDDLGSSFTFGLRLLGNGTHHTIVEIDLFHFHVGDFDPPPVGLVVQDGLDVGAQFFSFRKHVVEFMLPEHRAQRGLCQLAGGFIVILNLDDRPFRVHHPEVDHRVDFDRDIVPGNDILGGNVQHHGAKIDPKHLLQPWDDDDQPGTLDAPEASKHENHSALVFTENFDH